MSLASFVPLGPLEGPELLSHLLVNSVLQSRSFYSNPGIQVISLNCTASFISLEDPDL